jgi:hypothetical protein
MRLFFIIGGVLILAAMLIAVRFLYFYWIGRGIGHIQSLILAAVLMIMGFQSILMGLMADLVGFNRKILEEILYRLRKNEFEETRTQTGHPTDSFSDED